MFDKIKEGKRLSIEGKDHLLYLNQINRQEFDAEVDLPANTPKKEIDKALDAAITKQVFEMLEQHKTTCTGCTPGKKELWKMVTRRK